jgi:hypothetical protein
MFLAGIQLQRNNGCPIKAFGHDLSLYFAEMETNLLSVPNTIGCIYNKNSKSTWHLTLTPTLSQREKT